MKVLLVTNDFPPRVGGIQVYLWNIYRRLAEQGIEVRVLAPAFPGAETFDSSAPVEVVRWPAAMAWPSRSLLARARDLAREADVVAFGAVLPMTMMSRYLDLRVVDRPVVDRPVVVHTHGFEVAWARLPVLAQRLRRIGRSAAAVTVVSDFTRRHIERTLGSGERVHMLRTGVDLDRFHPGLDPSDVRARYGLGTRPVVVCVSRLVARKGQDRLIRALPRVQRKVPDAAALIVGGGPMRDRLEALARARGISDSVVFASEVPEAELAAHYAAGDVFAMPCRSRFAGMEVEGLGLVYLEAQACARPAITGDSGGAPEAVRVGETGEVVAGRDTRALAGAIAPLLADSARARAMGEAGRRFVEANHRWEDVVARYRELLGSL